MQSSLAPRRARGTRQSASLGSWFVLAALISLVAACGDSDRPPLIGVTTSTPTEGTDTPPPTDAASPTDPPETAPATTAAPEPPPDTSPPTTVAPETGDDDDTTWIAVVLIAAIGTIGLVALFAALRNRSAAPPPGGAPAGGAPSTARSSTAELDQLIGASQVINDQVTVEMLAQSDPARAEARWADARQRIVELETQAATLAVGTTDPNLREALDRLRGDLAALTGSMDTWLSLRTGEGIQAPNAEALLDESTDTVMRRRQALRTSIGRVEQMRNLG